MLASNRGHKKVVDLLVKAGASRGGKVPRDIDYLVNFFEGKAANTSPTSRTASVPIAQIKTKKRKGRGSQQANRAPVRSSPCPLELINQKKYINL